MDQASKHALCVAVDGTPLATVAFGHYELLTVHVFGSRIDEDFAILDMSGGSFGGPRPSGYLTWINAVALRPGQVVTVSFLADAPTSHAGRTADELYPDAEPDDSGEPPPGSDTQEPAAILHPSFSFELDSSNGGSYSGRLAPDELNFGFSVIWTGRHDPDHVRVSLHTSTLEAVQRRDPPTYRFNGKLRIGEQVKLALGT